MDDPGRRFSMVLLAGFTVPKYFAGDYFQRAGFESYQ